MSQDGLRILFAGTPEFAVPPLAALIEAGHPVIAVLTQPDRPAGRGRQVRPSPVKAFASRHGLEVLQPARLRDPSVTATLEALRVDLMVVAAYGLILPPDTLGLPRHGCWNIHASLLPRWRGAAPIARAIEAGDTETGVCIMRMEAGLDTGPVYACERTPISADDTAGTLHDRLSEMGASVLMRCIGQLLAGDLPEPVPQGKTGVTYANKVEKPEARIDWDQPAVGLERRIRAFNPWPVAWCELGGERLRIWRASALPRESPAAPGQVLSAGPEGIDVGTAAGVLRLLEVQRPGGRPLPAGEYLRARPLVPAT